MPIPPPPPRLIALLQVRPCWLSRAPATVTSRSAPLIGPSLALTPERNSTPASTASWIKRASRVSRERPMPSGKVNTWDAFWCRISRREMETPSRKTCSMPNRCKAAIAARFSEHPHTFCLGKIALSTRMTLDPQRATSLAVTAPAGPAPITTTSAVMSVSTSGGIGTEILFGWLRMQALLCAPESRLLLW